MNVMGQHDAPVRTTLRLVTALPDGASGRYADYDERTAPPSGWHRLDVRERCHAQQGEWAHAITHWHDELMAATQAATRWSWLLPGSRLHVWQPPVRPFLFALGLWTQLRQDSGGEVLAVGCPPEVGPYVQELSGGIVLTIDERQAPSAPGRGAGIVGRILRMAASLQGIPLVPPRRTPPAEVDLLVLSLGLSAESIRERGDHYFGRALDTPELSTHWLYQVGAANDRGGSDAALAACGRTYSFDHRLVSWADVVGLVRTAWDVRRRMIRLQGALPELRIAGTVSRHFPQRFFHELFINALPLGELILHRAATRLLQSVSPRAICYPYEEKGMERALLMANEATSRPAVTIGFAHAAYNSGMLYLSESSIEGARPPRPDLLVAAGLGFGGWLAGQFRRNDVVTTVGSPRWTPATAERHERRQESPLRVLFLTGMGPELFRLLEWLAQSPGLFERSHLTVRSYPHGWHSEQLQAFAELRKEARVTVEERVPLDAQLRQTDLVLYCSTSAVAEAIRSGRLVAYVEWSDLWSTDPLQGKADAGMIQRCQTPAQLRATMDAVAAMDASAYQRAVAAQRAVADRIYAPFDRTRFRDVVMGAAGVTAGADSASAVERKEIML